MFLSLGIVYWVQTLLHWCDSNAVFIVDVSRVHANSLLQKMTRNKIKAYTHYISENFQWYTNKRIKNALEIGHQHYKPTPNSNIFVVKYQSFTKFLIRWPVSKYIL